MLSIYRSAAVTWRELAIRAAISNTKDGTKQSWEEVDGVIANLSEELRWCLHPSHTFIILLMQSSLGDSSLSKYVILLMLFCDLDQRMTREPILFTEKFDYIDGMKTNRVDLPSEGVN